MQFFANTGKTFFIERYYVDSAKTQYYQIVYDKGNKNVRIMDNLDGYEVERFRLEPPIIEDFNLTVSSAITDAEQVLSKGYYNPATKEVHLTIQILSRSGKIPTANQAIVTIPSQYRPTTSYLRLATISSPGNFSTPHIERLQINTNGSVAMNNFIWGTGAVGFISIDVTYNL